MRAARVLEISRKRCQAERLRRESERARAQVNRFKLCYCGAFTLVILYVVHVISIKAHL